VVCVEAGVPYFFKLLCTTQLGVAGWASAVRSGGGHVVTHGTEHRQDRGDDLNFHWTDQMDPGKFGEPGMASDAGEPVGPWVWRHREVDDRDTVDEAARRFWGLFDRQVMKAGKGDRDVGLVGTRCEHDLQRVAALDDVERDPVDE
jgi:hypothetical protein